MKNLLSFITICLVSIHSFSQTTIKKNIVQFESCDKIHRINLDSFQKSLRNDTTLTMIIFRAEETKIDSIHSISVFDFNKLKLDTNLIKVQLYELKTTKGVYSCFFPHLIGGKLNNIRAIPPKFFLTSADTLLLNFIQKKLPLNFSSNSRNFLLPSQIYTSQEGFYIEAAKIISVIQDSLIKEYVSTKKINNLPHTPLKNKNNIVKNQYGFAIGLGSFLQQYKSASTTIGRSNQSFEKSPLFVNINGFYKTHLSEKVYLKFGLDLLYYSSSIYNKNLYSLPVSSTFITNPNYTINPTNPLAKSNYLVVGLSASAGYKIKLVHKLLLNLEGGFCVGKSIHGWSDANFNVAQGAATTTIKNYSSFSDKISIYFIANPNIEYALNKNCNLHFGLFSARGFSKMSSNDNYQFINDNGRYSALENATDKLSSQSLSFTTGVSFNLK